MSLEDISVGKYAKFDVKKASGDVFIIISEIFSGVKRLWREHLVTYIFKLSISTL